MSTWSLLRWVALVAGVEFALHGYWSDRGPWCHGGALLAAWSLAALLAPTRARLAGLAATALLSAVIVGDALWVALADPIPEAAPADALPSPTAPTPHATAASEPAIRVLVLGGFPERAGGDWAARLASALDAHLDCPRAIRALALEENRDGSGATAFERALAAHAPALVLLAPGPAALDALSSEVPTLRVASASEPVTRVSAIGLAIERRWQRAAAARAWRGAREAAPRVDLQRSAFLAEARERVLAARRAGAEVAVLIAPLALGVEAPEAALRAAERRQPGTRSRVLAQHAHARAMRGLAGSYRLRVVDVGPLLDRAGSAAFVDAIRLSRSGAARVAEATAAELAELLAQPGTGCRETRD